MLDKLLASDLRLSSWARECESPRWLEWWLVVATRLGDGWAWVATAIPLLLIGAEGRRVLMAGIVAGAVANVIQVVLKRSFRRARPCERSGRARHDVLAPDQFSFPSGHTLNAVMVAVLLGMEFPTFLPLLALLATSVGASRVFLGLHYASDVIAAAVLGAVLGGLVHHLLL